MSLLIHKQLAGYSGARIFLMSQASGDYFVRKQAYGFDHNQRLRRQMEKQEYFYALSGRPFGIPKVYRSGEKDGCFFYDMEFIDGMDAPTSLATTGLAEVRDISDQVVQLLQFFASQQPFDAGNPEIFSVLSRRVLAVTRRDLGLPTADAIRILEGLDDLAASDSCAATVCHGDLSLENVIVSRSGQLLLVDLLDAPLCHYWQDVAKIFLDLDGHWYARRYPRISEWTLAVLRERIIAFMSEHAQNYLKYHSVLVAVNFVRILPYATSADDRALLLQGIHRALHSRSPL